jgi:thymidine kinase
MWLMAWADVIEEIKTVCWCGKAATCNARFDENGNMIRSGEQIVMGANDRYVAVCRKHHRNGQLGDTTFLDGFND